MRISILIYHIAIFIILLLTFCINKSEAQTTDNELKELIQKTKFHNHYYLKLRFHEIPSESLQNELQKKGVELLAFISGKEYMAAIREEAIDYIIENGNITAFTPFKEESRTHPLLHGYLSDNLKQDSFAWLKVAVQYFRNINKDIILNTLQEMNYTIVHFTPNLHNLVLHFPSNRLAELACEPWLYRIEPVPPDFTPSNLSAKTSHRSNLLDNNSNPLINYTGKGIKMGIWDVGPIGYHIDLTDRVSIREDSLGESSHATFVAGNMAGAGLLQANRKGMAEDASIYSWDFWGWVPNEIDSAIGIDSIVITQHSYNYQHIYDTCWKRGHYDVFSYLNDLLAVNHPYLLNVYSAGNFQSQCSDNGFRTISSGPQAAKNIINVGAVTATDGMSSLSSWGPMRDGRLKPEVVGVGVSVTSTTLNDKYTTATGTSVSCPGVSGSLAQLYQLYRDIHRSEPDASTLKAIICNTAKDLGNTGPDYKFGFGRIDAGEAAQTIKDKRFIFDNISHQQKKLDSIVVGQGVAQLKVMLCWTDPPAMDYNSPFSSVLVNHLDLLVFDEDMNRYYPFILNPAKPDDIAVAGIDTLNNIEQVVINDPKAGKYYIGTEATYIPMGRQSYTITYEIVENRIKVTYPSGNENLVPGTTASIRWNAVGNTGNFIIAFSSDEGLSWDTITTNVAFNLRHYNWKIPNIISGQCLIRISSSNNLTGSSDTFFSIMTKVNNFNYHNNGGHLLLYWRHLHDASHYRIYQVKNGKWHLIDKTSDSFYFICSLRSNSKYYYGIRSFASNGAAGQMSDALVVLTDSLYVYPEILISTRSGKFCSNDNIHLWYSIKGHQTFFKNWEYSMNKGASWEEIEGATDTFLFLQELSAGQDYLFRIKLTDSCRQLTIISEADSISIYPELNINLLIDKDTVCYAEGVRIKAEVNGGREDTYIYKWSHSDDNVSEILIYPDKTQMIRLSITDACNPEAVTDSAEIFVIQPNSDWTYNIYEKKLSVQALNKAAKTYFWDFGDGNFAYQSDTNHYYNVEGTYLVCLSVTDSFGCDSSLCKTIETSSLEDAGIRDSKSLKIIPNPNKGVFSLVIPPLSSKEYEIRICNPQGEIVFVQQYKNAVQPMLDLTNKRQGLYFLFLITSDKIISHKLIIH